MLNVRARGCNSLTTSQFWLSISMIKAVPTTTILSGFKHNTIQGYLMHYFLCVCVFKNKNYKGAIQESSSLAFQSWPFNQLFKHYIFKIIISKSLRVIIFTKLRLFIDTTWLSWMEQLLPLFSFSKHRFQRAIRHNICLFIFSKKDFSSPI